MLNHNQLISLKNDELYAAYGAAVFNVRRFTAEEQMFQGEILRRENEAEAEKSKGVGDPVPEPVSVIE